MDSQLLSLWIIQAKCKQHNHSVSWGLMSSKNTSKNIIKHYIYSAFFLYCSKKYTVMCCLLGNFETSFNEHHLTTHKINSHHVAFWRTTPGVISILASLSLSPPISAFSFSKLFYLLSFIMSFYFHPLSCADRNRAQPAHKPKQDAFTSYSISNWTAFDDTCPLSLHCISMYKLAGRGALQACATALHVYLKKHNTHTHTHTHNEI